MGKLIPNAFNLAVVIYVALGSTACSYGEHRAYLDQSLLVAFANNGEY